MNWTDWIGVVGGVIGGVLVPLWVAKRNRDHESEIESLKARLVLEGEIVRLRYGSLRDLQVKVLPEAYARVQRAYWAVIDVTVARGDIEGLATTAIDAANTAFTYFEENGLLFDEATLEHAARLKEEFVVAIKRAASARTAGRADELREVLSRLIGEVREMHVALRHNFRQVLDHGAGSGPPVARANLADPAQGRR